MSKNNVSSELGRLQKLLIHRPDGGIGKVIPTKLHEWLYDDTVDLKRMREEYDEYTRVLLHFLDPEKAAYVSQHLKNTASTKERNAVLKPNKKGYFNSSYVIDVQHALGEILEDRDIMLRIVSAICALEGCSRALELRLEGLQPEKLAKVLITGIIDMDGEETFIFPPLPNLVFTRDVCIMVNDHLLLSRSGTSARRRESVIIRYVAFNHPLFFKDHPEKVIEITEQPDFFLEETAVQEMMEVSIEGGDIMMISPHHLVVGVSERTTASAADAIIKAVFERERLNVKKVTTVHIPAERAQMHIDTIFTQLRKDAWVLFGEFSEKLYPKDGKELSPVEVLSGNRLTRKAQHTQVTQFVHEADGRISHKRLKGIEEFMHDVSHNDFGVPLDEVKIVYSGGNVFPYDEREQWTDSCNLLAIKEGVVIGYDRNDKTIEAFEKQLDFRIIRAGELLELFESGKEKPEAIENTLILLSSSELSRARGGSHCMSMPLLRSKMD